MMWMVVVPRSLEKLGELSFLDKLSCLNRDVVSYWLLVVGMKVEIY